jgi:hypothetical protein
MLLFSLAVGTFAFVVMTRQLSDATPGYVRFTAATAASLAFLAALIYPSAPAGTLAIGVHPSPGLASAAALMTFLVGTVAALYAFRPSLYAGAFGLLVALSVLTDVAWDWVAARPDAMPLLVQLVMLSVVTGGSLAAIVLGHWYLVTPKISQRPLILQCRVLLAALALQLLLFVTWTTLAGGAGQQPFSAFTTGPVLLIVLRLVITLLFPLVLVYMAWRTARTRSMESATGLLYINFAAVMAGTIGASALYVSSGILA